MVYIRADKLPGLKQYKYSGVDHSLLSRYVLKPFYNNVVIGRFPMWMAPNAITLSGFAFVVINFLTLLWYNPTLDQDMPPWVYFSWAIGLFLYQTFDAVDGTQARRTRQSGPLGELFDHSVDAINTVLEVLLFAAAVNLGQGWNTVLTLFGSTLTFYIQTWDEYYTQTLTLGVISGPVEGILTLCFVYAVTGIMGGGSFWQQSLLRTIGIGKTSAIPDALYEMPWNQWYMVYGGLVLVFNTAQSIQHVQTNQTAKSRTPPLLGLLPYFLTWALVPLYLALQPVILSHHLIPFIFYIGLINAYAVGAIITAHLVKDPRFPLYNILTLPLLLAVLDSFGPVVGLWPSALGSGVYQISFLFMAVGLAVGVYGSFIYDIITTICDYLDIWCLSIKHPHVEASEGSNGGAKKAN